MTETSTPPTGTHVLVVTDGGCGGPGDPCTCEPRCLDYAIECPGVTEACRMWQTCVVPGCQANDRNFGWEGGTVHGVDHGLVDDQWMTPTGLCFVQNGFDLPGAGEDVSGGNLGRYLVDHDFGDGTELLLYAIKENAHV